MSLGTAFLKIKNKHYALTKGHEEGKNLRFVVALLVSVLALLAASAQS